MFNFSGGLLAGQHDSQKERPPPARPTPVTFPSLTPPQPSLDEVPPQWSAGASQGIAAHLLTLKKPSDVSLETLRQLNVSFEPQCEFQALLPSPVYLPPESWLRKPDVDEEPQSIQEAPLLSNGRKAPDRAEFFNRAKELFFKNEDAFSNLSRKAVAEKVPLRLAHFRRFWEGLDNLAYYWDTSLDEYLPAKQEASCADGDTSTQPTSMDASNDSPSNGSETQPELASLNIDEPRKKAKTAMERNHAVLPINSLGFANTTAGFAQPTSIMSSKALPARTAPPRVPWAMNMQNIHEKPVDLSKGSYRGYRIGNGAEMPDQYRLDCVRAFMEPIAWAFGVTLVPHRRPPVLCIEHVRFPVRMNSVAWRGPADRIKARQGWMEGPVLGIQCRPDVNFGSSGDLEAESVRDAVRELGGMLLLAQERDREGKTEKRAGDGKWWTTTRRWGGGPGGEVGEGDSSNGTSDAKAETPVSPVEERPSKLRPGPKDRRPRPSPAEIWKVLRPGNLVWDPKIAYEAIGKDKSSEWDEIFMVSSLNHHISVLKLRVHKFYIRFVTDGVLPENAPLDPYWLSPTLHRTRWYDLFNVEDRTEAMRGLWGIMAYLMRTQQQKIGDTIMIGS
ncbi:hypothetical protein EJ04DRAFT_326482 [Polyplosphaeria fusca]|uniref:Uncharacterized protein n=1 Tax=Polyplosphaeria fusca TaxID=682080 RepID=A0A9P4R7D4_9PLEO|nr:hypothetical protein EJ04DRAFT_326482 [Polyplosphaeria fusca]